MINPEPLAVNEPAAKYDPLLSYPVNENAKCPDSLELLVATSETTADPDAVVIACDVALTMTVAGLGWLDGAV